MTQKDRLIIGITGASGVIYGIRFLQLLKNTPIETHLVLSKAAERTIAYETDYKIREIKDMADVLHDNADIGAPIASGSFRVRGMVIAPCSMKSLAEVASGVADNLIARAADVMLKERRRLVLMARETPLHAGHIRNMAQATENGAIIAPPVPAFYARPTSLDQRISATPSIDKADQRRRHIPPASNQSGLAINKHGPLPMGQWPQSFQPRRTGYAVQCVRPAIRLI